MGNDEFLKKAKNLVMAERQDGEEPYIVWFSKTLQNWKALLSTNVADNLYYEVTYNGDKCEAYIDVYAKVRNTAITDEAYQALLEMADK